MQATQIFEVITTSKYEVYRVEEVILDLLTNLPDHHQIKITMEVKEI